MSIRNYFSKRKISAESYNTSRHTRSKKNTASGSTEVSVNHHELEKDIDSVEVTSDECTSPTPSLSEQNDESPIVDRASILKNLSMNSPVRPLRASYPQKRVGGQLRSFNSRWYEKFEWPEYIEELDITLCFACRQFSPASADKIYTTSGYNNWKHALEKGKGFHRHSEGNHHLEAMKSWEEYKKRVEKNETVENIMTEKKPDHRVWVETVFNVIKFLSMNGLPFRGDIENTDFTSDSFGGCVYLNIFAGLLFPVQPNLKKVAENLPRNAKYTSPEIQNEVITVLRSIVKAKIIKEVKEAKSFTVMVDGSTDKNRREIVGIVLRYVTSSDEVEEHALNVKYSEDRSAKGLLNVLLESLKEQGIDSGGIVSQCYDGANVMSGEHAGMQKLLSDFCERIILYIHCFCHRI